MCIILFTQNIFPHEIYSWFCISISLLPLRLVENVELKKTPGPALWPSGRPARAPDQWCPVWCVSRIIFAGPVLLRTEQRTERGIPVRPYDAILPFMSLLHFLWWKLLINFCVVYHTFRDDLFSDERSFLTWSISANLQIETRDKILRRILSITAQLLDVTDQQSSTSLSLVLLVGCEQDLKVKYVFVTFVKIFLPSSKFIHFRRHRANILNQNVIFSKF